MDQYKKIIKEIKTNLKLFIIEISFVSNLHNKDVLNRSINLFTKNIDSLEKEIAFQRSFISAEIFIKFSLQLLTVAILLVILKNGQTVYTNFPGIIAMAGIIKTRKIITSNIEKRKKEINRRANTLNNQFMLLKERKESVFQIEKEQKKNNKNNTKVEHHNLASRIRQEQIKQLSYLKDSLIEKETQKQLKKERF